MPHPITRHPNPTLHPKLSQFAQRQHGRMMIQIHQLSADQCQELLGCTHLELQAFLHKKMWLWNQDNPDRLMDWRNTHVDHIKPLSAVQRGGEVDPALLHYTNLQPLLKADNLAKSATWNDHDEEFWRRSISRQTDWMGIYIPGGASGSLLGLSDCKIGAGASTTIKDEVSQFTPVRTEGAPCTIPEMPGRY